MNIKGWHCAQGGFGWSAGAGTGLVVARRAGGCWSPPCAVALYSLGWGIQAGGALCDLLIVLRTPAAVAAFCGALHCGVAGSLSLAVGPLGRQAQATMQVRCGVLALW
jgi:lipid-binding SYLF domain-containing protein